MNVLRSRKIATSSVRNKARGFTLVELMISMVLGLLITAAILGLYLNMIDNNAEMEKTTKQIESGRFAIQLLQKNLAHAGYWGGYIPKFDNALFEDVPDDVPTAVPDPCFGYTTPWDAAYKTSLLGLPVQVSETVPTACASLLTGHLAGTDILVVRHAETCVPGGACTAAVAGELFFQTSRCDDNNPVTDDMHTYTLDTTALTLTQRDCVSAAETRRFVSKIYYVRDYAMAPGDGIPTLMRSTFGLNGTTLGHQEPVALAEGIENFKVELGIDSIADGGGATDYTVAIDRADDDTIINRGDGAIDGNFIRCTTAAPCDVATLLNVVTVKVHLLVRSIEDTSGYTSNKTFTLGGTNLGPYTDSYKRHVYSATARLTNISDRREAP